MKFLFIYLNKKDKAFNLFSTSCLLSDKKGKQNKRNCRNWGAIVITSLASAIPVVGDTIVTWLWGGFSVDNATLNRFFSLHHLLPFILVGASLLHLAVLHHSLIDSR